MFITDTMAPAGARWRIAGVAADAEGLQALGGAI
jgi:hypothetical protein